MDANIRIRRLMRDRGWSEYRLAKQSGLSQSTIANMFHRNTSPSIATLEQICKAFGITLSQFFDEGGSVSLTAEQAEMLNNWDALPPKHKRTLMELVRNMR